MIHGATRSFFGGTVAITQGLSAAEYDQQRVVVKKFVAEKCRWAVVLCEPRFKGKQIMVREGNLVFCDFARFESVLPELPGHLRVAPTGNSGEGLFCNRRLEMGEVVLEELPMMVVSNEGFDSRWTLHFRLQEQRNVAVLQAFETMSVGGHLKRYLADVSAEIVRSTQGESGMANEINMLPRAALDAEVQRLAAVQARWQANGHEFFLRGSEGKMSALFRFTLKMDHSCEPNCRGTVDAVEGVMTVEATRRIEAGEELTNSYMDIYGTDSDFPALGLADRQRRLLARGFGFTCACSRCLREAAEAKPAAQAKAEMIQLAEEVATATDCAC